MVKRQYAAEAFTGAGSARFGGRWNPKGLPVVYASASAALARLEVLVRLEDVEDLALFVLIPAQVPDDGIELLPKQALPRDWDAVPERPTTQIIGKAWFEGQRSLVLGVPSVIAPEELNYLINPKHPRFVEIEIASPRAVAWDRRLVKKLRSGL
jgi:RES domain-containing protein